MSNEEDKQEIAWNKLVQAFKEYMEFEPDFEFIVNELDEAVYK